MTFINHLFVTMFQANMFSVQGRTVREVTLFVAVIQDRFQFKKHDFDEKVRIEMSVIVGTIIF